MRVGVVVTAITEGGGQVYLRGLYTALAQRGVDCSLLGDIPRWAETRLPHHSLGFRPQWSRRRVMSSLAVLPRERWLGMRAIRAQHRVRPFDFFHLQFKREQILLSRSLKRMAPVVWTEHGRFPLGRGGAPLAAAYRRAARAVSAVICVSAAVRDDIGSILGGGSPPLVVIPNGVDVTRFRPATPEQRRDARRELGVPDRSGPVILTLSRLHATKRVDLAMEAAELIEGAVMIAGGDGPDRARLEERAAGREVIFPGHVDRPELLYASADVFVLPSGSAAREGLPIALIEAAASGLPIVTVTGSGVEAEAGCAGGLVVDADPASLAAGIRSALDGGDGRRARRWAEAHDLASSVDRHLRVMTETVMGVRRE